MRSREAACAVLMVFLIIAAPSVASTVATNGAPRVVTYYFHRTARCAGCRALERLTRKAVADMTAAGEEHLVLRVVNVDEPENEHFIEDFNLTFNTVVIAKEELGATTAWTNLSDAVWGLYEDEDNYKAFIQEKILDLETASSPTPR